MRLIVYLSLVSLLLIPKAFSADAQFICSNPVATIEYDKNTATMMLQEDQSVATYSWSLDKDLSPDFPEVNSYALHLLEGKGTEYTSIQTWSPVNIIGNDYLIPFRIFVGDEVKTELNCAQLHLDPAKVPEDFLLSYASLQFYDTFNYQEISLPWKKVIHPVKSLKDLKSVESMVGISEAILALTVGVSAPLISKNSYTLQQHGTLLGYIIKLETCNKDGCTPVGVAYFDPSGDPVEVAFSLKLLAQ